jgi:hypothetical protein
MTSWPGLNWRDKLRSILPEQIMRLIVVSLLLAVATFTTPACADPPNAFVDAYRRGDWAEVLRMTRSLAEQGHPAAQAALADLYLRGRGVPKDEAEAIRWFRRAAEQGYANAQVQLGALYGMGQGVPQDFAQSAIWYLRAAQAGHAHSQLKVGFLYFEGRGVPTDYISSYMWFNVAATNSSGDIHADAVEARDQISGLMTVEQIAEAQRLSRNWKPVKWTKGPPAASPAAASMDQRLRQFIMAQVSLFRKMVSCSLMLTS